ncbi:MAG: FAD-dependent oxidoreductase [Defluviitaleaceae bacterium]|nr:FAD-dependent oxidoreductase [Defluviitaleaceae bacterium]
MIYTDLLVVGAGPAGLSAAAAAGTQGLDVLVLERSHQPGGQLVKQTHMFFGSKEQYAAYRGFEIADFLLDMIKMPNVKLQLNATALAAYDDGIWTAQVGEKYIKVKPRAVVVAAGANERNILFPGNDLPGVYGAGAVQTLMNQYGVRPAKRVVMLGAGNIGLIVSYQLLQAGVEVAAVVEASPNIGGYLVHASKLRRMGVPILTSHTVKRADGNETLESVTTWAIDEKWQGIPSTEVIWSADTLCIAVGLSPLCELLWQAGCKMVFVPELGGYVPYRDGNMATSIEGIYAAGDAAGVEEASVAMVGGKLAGLSAARYLGVDIPDESILDCHKQLEALRSGPAGAKIRAGLGKLTH